MADCVLPEDIMLCILSRLPVNSILRFKSVCKSWRNLFETLEFAKLHRDQPSTDSNNQALIGYSLSQTFISLLSIEPIAEKRTILDLPYQASFDPCSGSYGRFNGGSRPSLRYNGGSCPSLRYLGCCNGLVCIGFGQFDCLQVIALWNPALRLSKFLPASKRYSRNTSLGFGYDAEGDDYKVVRIIDSYNNKGMGIEVYSAKSDSWKIMPVGFSGSLWFYQESVIVNTNPYWVAKTDENMTILCYDVTNLELKMVPLPTNIELLVQFKALVDWKGSLAVLVSERMYRASIAVWVFDDFEMIWKKNHTFYPSIAYPNMSMDRCLQCSINGKILFESYKNKKLYVLDPETGWVEEIEDVRHDPRNVAAFRYNESLVRIEGMEKDPIVPRVQGLVFKKHCLARVIPIVVLKTDSPNKDEPARRNQKQTITKRKSKGPIVVLKTDSPNKDEPARRNQKQTITKRKSKGPIAVAMANCVLPDDIMLCILTRLPKKSLLRFKSVCKAWCKLCSTANFIKMHGHQFSNDFKKQDFIVPDSSTTCSFLSVESNAQKTMNLEVPYPVRFSRRATYVGCCNGLICVSSFDWDNYFLVLWNPALRLSKSIPLPNVVFRVNFLGFGYDDERDDFKVLMTQQMNKEEKNKRVRVYSVKSDSWKTVEVGFEFGDISSKNTVNGNPYWVTQVERYGCIVWCDVTKLEFSTIPLSSVIQEHVTANLPFVDWKGSLAALVVTKDSPLPSINVWVFDDGETIWRLNHTFVPSELHVDRCLQLTENGKIIVKCSEGKLYVFDPETGSVREIENRYPNRHPEIYAYNKSLAYIEGMEV